MKINVQSLLLGIAISLLYLVVRLFTVSHYGMHADNPAHYMRGQAYLHRILTGKDFYSIPDRPSPVLFVQGQRVSYYILNALENTQAPIRPIGSPPGGMSIQKHFYTLMERIGARDTFYRHNSWVASYWDNPDDPGHPAVSNIIMAMFNNFIYVQNNLLGDVESYHFYVILVTSLAVFAVFYFVWRVFGLFEGIVAAITLATFPFFFGESHFNIKDPVQMSFFTIAVISFYFFIKEKLSLFWYGFLIGSVFLALGTKWNIIFLPFIVIPWLIIISRRVKEHTKISLKKVFIFLVVLVIVSFLLLIVAWPSLWENPLIKLGNVIIFYLFSGIKDVRLEGQTPFLLPFGFSLYATFKFMAMTPPIMLVLFLAGFVVLIKKSRSFGFAENILLLLWFFVPLLRVSHAETVIAGGIRNYIELLAPFSIIVAIGAKLLIDKIVVFFRGVSYWKVAVGFITCYFVIQASLLFRLHPNENIYFNFLTGGLRGAIQQQFYTWESSYGNVYRQGINWMNTNGEKNARIAYLDGTMTAMSPIWLRDDIKIGSFFSGFEQKGEYIISLTYPRPPTVFPYLFLEKYVSPVHEVIVDGYPVLKIWKNDKRYLKEKIVVKTVTDRLFSEETKRYKNKFIREFNFPRPLDIAKVVLKLPNKECIDAQGVWSVVVEDKEQYILPLTKQIDGSVFELNFPGLKAGKLKLWDSTGASCIYQSKLQSISAIQKE